jgi:predicted O-linked N-acetylglucosamine transferase (SPINDLY family)
MKKPPQAARCLDRRFALLSVDDPRNHPTLGRRQGYWTGIKPSIQICAGKCAALGKTLRIRLFLGGCSQSFRAHFSLLIVKTLMEPQSSELGVAEFAQGLRLVAQGKLDDAITAFRASVRANPTRGEFYSNLGAALIQRGEYDEAATVLRVGIRLAPKLAALRDNLCNALFRSRKYDEAIKTAIEALNLSPGEVSPHMNLAMSLRSAGDVDGAMREYREALRIDPISARAAAGLAYLANFDPRLDSRGVLAVARDWAQRFETPILPRQRPHTNRAEPDRRLKIGYVSPNFHYHAEAHFVLPLLEHHDHDRFEVHCFSISGKQDNIAERHRRAADHWYDFATLSDEDASSLIRQMEIDILIDVTMHMADNRLPIFCHKPAPIQAAWLAYPGTTGLASMDYRITDAIIDPPGLEDPSSEKPVRLPNYWVCYDPLSQAAPRKEERRGFISFGSLNTGIKLSEQSVRLWGRLLQRVPNSRLVMIACTAREVSVLRKTLSEIGISQDRIGLSPEVSREKYLRLHDEIDIALDTLPYNGITTALDALWMNVPMVTLVGPRAQGRSCASLLHAAGLPELIARSEDEFLETAAGLANDGNRLDEHHQTLRTRLERSPLMDGKAFAVAMEDAYRHMWRGWCAAKAQAV